ncbi:hypothetical protein UF66_2258 [Staphylococcus cohnii subsp. cohnii]|jgi:hypothetical protein|uniref:Uncharacterized protein n=1 Tax=Staphylococcus cohnii subsp. cohnii TaxID=74704 RepID=A0A0M2NY06_STACC|nr:hypothetical protein UF66_2258 [Staphylococcus cohnii subsp. cohnii]
MLYTLERENLNIGCFIIVLSTTFESEITDLTVHKLSKKDLLKTLKKECIIYNQQ